MSPAEYCGSLTGLPGRRTIVRVVYSDESGTGSIKEEPITVVAAVVINLDTQWEKVENDLNQIAPDENYEFKGARLFRDLKNGRKRDQADRLLKGILSVPAKNRLAIYQGAVDRKGFETQGPKTPSKFDANDAAFFICLSQIEAAIHGFLPDERILWIADHSGHYEKRLKLGHRIFRMMQEFELIPGVPARKSCLVDTVYFGDSRDSRALQLADVCCSTICVHLRGDPIVAPYYDLLRFRIQNAGSGVFYA
jgi:uncharacterized protein DUF3800